MSGVSTGSVQLLVDDLIVLGVDEPQGFPGDPLDPAGVEEGGLAQLEHLDALFELPDPLVALADVDAQLDGFGLAPDVEGQDADGGGNEGRAERDPPQAPFTADHHSLSPAPHLAA